MLMDSNFNSKLEAEYKRSPLKSAYGNLYLSLSSKSKEYVVICSGEIPIVSTGFASNQRAREIAKVICELPFFLYLMRSIGFGDLSYMNISSDSLPKAERLEYLTSQTDLEGTQKIEAMFFFEQFGLSILFAVVLDVLVLFQPAVGNEFLVSEEIDILIGKEPELAEVYFDRFGKDLNLAPWVSERGPFYQQCLLKWAENYFKRYVYANT